MTVVEALQRCPLFKDFTETGLKIFASIAVERSFAPGTPLFVENMVGESMFILKSGTVRITQRDGPGERELATIGAGEHLGALSLLGRGTRLVSAVAASPCEAIELSQRDFVRLQPQKPQACLKLACAIGADLAAKVQDSRDAVRDLGARRPAGG